MISESDLSTILESALQELKAGASLQQVLARYSDVADSLRPLLEEALILNHAGVAVRVPASAQIDSKRRMLILIEQQKAAAAQTPSWRSGPIYRWSLAGILVIVVLAVGLLGTSLVSAASVPGDIFYPVKLAVEQTRLNLTTNSASRLGLEEQFEKERVNEIVRLSEMGRGSAVNFAGPLSYEEAEGWEVGGIGVDFSPKIDLPLNTLLGAYLEIKGNFDGRKVNVDEVNIQQYQINGRVEEYNSQQIKVNELNILLSDRTYFSGPVTTDELVEVSVTRLQDGSLLALAVHSSGSSDTPHPEESNPINLLPQLPFHSLSEKSKTEESNSLGGEVEQEVVITSPATQTETTSETIAPTSRSTKEAEPTDHPRFTPQPTSSEHRDNSPVPSRTSTQRDDETHNTKTPMPSPTPAPDH